jgi:predicted RND superfamily exporter protein
MTGRPHRESFVARYVTFLARNDLTIALCAFVLFLASAAMAARLKLRSDFTELLPQDDPELTQLRNIGDRIGAPSTLIIAVEGSDSAANERFAEALVKNLRGLIGSDLTSIDYRPHAADPFFESNKELYADLVDLHRVDDDLRKLLASRKNPAFIPFADSDLREEDDDPRKDLALLRRGLEKQRSAAKPFPSGYYESEDRALLAIVTWTRSSGTGDLSGFKIRDDIQRTIDETRPSAFGAMTVRLTGDVASAIEEHDALKSDIEWVSLVCTVLVLLVISLYYRSVISLCYVFFPTLLGVAVAFAITALTIGYLNTNTAFLGSIILGNGINFGIIFLARYREERLNRPTDLVELALARAIENTAKPTLAAALAAAIAYGSLALTTFRGFRQFGEVGGVGMLLCWAATYSYCPALIHFAERLARPRPRGRSVSSGALLPLAGALLRNRRSLTAVVIGATTLAAWSLAPVLRSPFEYDFSKLRNQRSRKRGAGDLYVRVGRIFPQDLAPVGVAILPRSTDAPSYRAALLAKDCADALVRSGDRLSADPRRLLAECARRVAAGEPTGGLLSAVATVYDFLPKDQDAKLEILARIQRQLKDPVLDELGPRDKAEIDRWTPPLTLRALTPADLPDEIGRRFREVDGTIGRVALIFPVRVWPNWDGHSLIRLSEVLKNVRLPTGELVNAAGHPTLFAAMLRSIAHDGPIASGAAAVGVVLAVVLLFRGARPITWVLSSLLLGVIWMGGAGAAIGLKLNFLNFVALPVTLGIGVDYAVNVFARLVREPAENRARALAETGSAVALCSSTTIIGYSSLLIASNGALRSFGKLADLGELGCLLAALLVVPMVTRPEAPRAPR